MDTMMDGMLDLTALIIAGMIGALVVEPTKVAVRVSANRVRKNGRRR
jgi:hypothetical protein